MADEQTRNRRSTDDDDERKLEKILGFERVLHDKILIMELEQKYVHDKLELLVSKLEFAPVRMLVFGTTAIVLTSFVGALVALVISK